MPYHASTAKTIIGLDIFAVLSPTLQIATVGWTKASHKNVDAVKLDVDELSQYHLFLPFRLQALIHRP